jgi:hypothetical protein
LEAADADALVKDVEGFEVKNLFLELKIIEAER